MTAAQGLTNPLLALVLDARDEAEYTIEQPAAPTDSSECLPVARQPWLSAFTLIEVCIAMTIGILILGVATLSVTGIQDEQALRESAARIEATARDSMIQALAQHRPIQLALAGGINGADGNVEVKRYGETKFRKPERDEMWEFSPTGVCEPIDLRVISPKGVIELSFDPLTGCARKRNVSVKS